jgi:hypothetical protein
MSTPTALSDSNRRRSGVDDDAAGGAVASQSMMTAATVRPIPAGAVPLMASPLRGHLFA